MPRAGLNKEKLIEEAAKLANERGVGLLSLKMLADQIGVKSPSLYKHIQSLDELKQDLMFYGWSKLEKNIYEYVIGKSGDAAVKAMCKAYYDFAVANPGVFECMLFYNRYLTAKNREATQGIYKITSKIFAEYNLEEKQMMHLVRTFRGFFQGYMQLVIGNGFGSSLSLEESFEFSVEVLIKGIKQLSEEVKVNDD